MAHQAAPGVQGRDRSATALVTNHGFFIVSLIERDTRIELASPAWEADVLPLY